jgi:hypothetical protein
VSSTENEDAENAGHTGCIDTTVSRVTDWGVSGARYGMEIDGDGETGKIFPNGFFCEKIFSISKII